MSTNVRTIRFDPLSAWTKPASNSSERHGIRWMRRRDGLDEVVEHRRQVPGAGDVLLAISTSGNSSFGAAGLATPK